MDGWVGENGRSTCLRLASSMPTCPPPRSPERTHAHAHAEGQLLADQAASVKEYAEFVAQVSRRGRGEARHIMRMSVG